MASKRKTADASVAGPALHREAAGPRRILAAPASSYDFRRAVSREYSFSTGRSLISTARPSGMMPLGAGQRRNTTGERSCLDEKPTSPSSPSVISCCLTITASYLYVLRPRDGQAPGKLRQKNPADEGVFLSDVLRLPSLSAQLLVLPSLRGTGTQASEWTLPSHPAA